MANNNNNIHVFVNEEFCLALPTNKDGRYIFNEVLAKIQSEQLVQPNGQGKLPVTVVSQKK